MRETQRHCDVYLNNERYRFDAGRKVFMSSSGLEPRVVTMHAVKEGHVHAALWRAYVIGGVPYYYDEVRDELMRAGNPALRLNVNDYTSLVGIGAVSAPRGDVFKAIMDRELRALDIPTRPREMRDRDR